MKYHERPELSFHQLMDFAKSPECYYQKHIVKNPFYRKPPSAAMAFGTAMHLAVLQPDIFKNEVKLIPQEHRTPSGEISTKKETKAFLAQNNDTVFLSDSDFLLVNFLGDRCKNAFWKFLEKAKTEQVILTEIDGIQLRAQIDIIDFECGVHDLKTIKSFDDVEETIKKKHYIEQLSWYAHLTKGHVGKLLFAETEIPYRCMVYKPTTTQIVDAFNNNLATFEDYKKAREHDAFADYLIEIN